MRTKPPGCCEWWRGNPVSSRARSSVSRTRWSAGSNPSARVGLADPFPAPDAAGEGASHVRRQAEGLANVAHGAARAVADYRGAERRVVAAVGIVDPADHLLPPSALEVEVEVEVDVDVDVGRLLALSGDEALEEEVAALRIDQGDA